MADDKVADDKVAERELTAALAEFQALRGEILQRVQIQELILGLTITTIGALLTVALAGKTSRAALLLATPFVTSALGVVYTDQSHRILLLGCYVKCKLWPRVARLTSAELPSWEKYLRESRQPLRGHLPVAYIATLFVLAPGGADVYAAVALHGRLTTAEWVLFATGLLTAILCLALAVHVGRQSCSSVRSV